MVLTHGCGVLTCQFCYGDDITESEIEFLTEQRIRRMAPAAPAPPKPPAPPRPRPTPTPEESRLTIAEAIRVRRIYHG